MGSCTGGPRRQPAHLLFALISVAAVVAAVCCFEARAQSAPPRSIDDLLKVLDHYKPDPKVAEKARADADRQPPNTDDKKDLADFYLARGRAAAKIGRVSRQIEDLRRAAEYAKAVNAGEVRVIETELTAAEVAGGNLLNAVRLRESLAESAAGPGQAVGSYSSLVFLYCLVGDLPAARDAFAKAEAALASLRTARRWKLWGRFWTMHVERARGELALAEGKIPEAEDAFRKALTAHEADAPMNDMRLARSVGGVTAEVHNRLRESLQRRLATALSRQARFAESEATSRAALQSSLTRTGRYSPDTGNGVSQLANILYQQGRYREAAVLAREAIDIFDKAGASPESRFLINARRNYGAVLAVQGKWSEANTEFQKMRAGLEHDPLLLQKLGSGDLAWSLALTRLGQSDKAIAMLTRMLERARSRFGDTSFPVAEIRGFLGIAHAAGGQRDAALKEFAAAVPQLLDQVNAQSGESGGAARTWRLIQILESYIGALVETVRGGQQAPGVDALAESFRLADVARGGRVQQALAASAARAAISDPALAELARKEQDAEQRTGALDELLRNMLSAAPDQQIPKVIEDLRKEISTLRQEHRKLRSEIEQRFPDYAQLTNPKPATLEQARKALKPGEALISIYVSEAKTYVWAIRPGGTTFAVVPFDAAKIRSIVTQLRKALDIDAAPIEQFPKFDVTAAHQLYSALLQPVEAGWKDASSLLIVPHRELGQLPFGVLVTAPTELPADTGLRFESYKTVPWLLRTAAITQLPSVNALVTLRSAPAPRANRRAFAGFGDPYFTKEQQAQAAQEVKVQLAAADRNTAFRNLSIAKVAVPAEASDGQPAPPPSAVVANSSTLSQLARLPDTSIEIIEIAQALNADFNKDVFLGEKANEQNVKTMNLADRRVIAFATHGLVPGDLNGLDQPALALTAPEIAGIDGDGLLTMDEILALKLDADWVVLSACNTAAGEGAGSEAVSGLGRAFFYAGARALLVSNWPVETVSARLLTTDLFKRQSANPQLTRAEALRQTMLGLLDEGRRQDGAGRAQFSYAHPTFWAPFSLVGDGFGK